MITDEIKKQVLESLIQELDVREVDSMDKEPGEAAEDACAYCGESTAEDCPECSMHSLGPKPAMKPKPDMKIKIGGGGKGSF
jgi:hypothetical protein